MTLEEMMNNMATTRGLEDELTVDFFKMCETETNLDLISAVYGFYINCPYDE